MKKIYTLFALLAIVHFQTYGQLVGSSPCLTAYPSAPSIEISVSNSVNLVANPAPSGFTYRWFNSDGASQMSTSQMFTTPIITESKTFFLAYFHTSSGCLSAKVPVRVILNTEQTKRTHVRSYTSRVESSSFVDVMAGNPSQTLKVAEYYDSLGRPRQSIAIKASPKQHDIITPIAYDTYGRQFREYLPFSDSSGTMGVFRTNAVALHATYHSGKFGGDIRGFADKTFENSPLHRVLKQGVPGSDWIGKEIQTNDGTNAAGETVQIWSVLSSGLPVNSGSYPAGALFKTTIVDEDGRTSIEYKDKLGRVILNKVQVAATPGQDYSGWLCTHFVYDLFGRLRVVMPPKAIEHLRTGGWANSADPALADAQYFRYTYDERGRVISKKLPGKNIEEMVYDVQDRLVAYRDGNLTAQGKWMYTKYDALGRVVMTGLVADAQNRQNLQTLVNGIANNNNAVINATSGKTGTTNAGGYPTTGEGEVLSVVYYDHYNFQNSALAFAQQTGYTARSTKTHGLMTGKLVRNLGVAQLGTKDLYETAIYYDHLGRLVQTVSEHHRGGTMRISSKYNFENKPIETLTQISYTGGSQTVKKGFLYNNAGLLSSITHQINSNPQITLATFTYDELGQLTGKRYPGANDAKFDYTYNIRGWLKRINNPGVSNASTKLFAQELYYQDAGDSIRQFNGNIARATWKGQDNTEREYTYRYDPANRLTKASYRVPTASVQNGRYSLPSITYDPNGNITALKRHNQVTATTWGLVDNLTYSYNSHENRLANVTDAVVNSNHLSKDFRNDSGNSSYAYDVNANLTANSDKNITQITYNHLNLPQTITFTGTARKIDFWYSADGVKMRQKNTDGAVEKEFDYLGEFVFEGTTLSYIMHEEGRAALESSTFQYEFFVKDHLGNVRQVIRAMIPQPRIATMEPDRAEDEEKEFGNIKESRQPAHAHNATPGGYATAWLNAARGRALGPNRTQEVQKGDSITLSVLGKYVDIKPGAIRPKDLLQPVEGAPASPLLTDLGQPISAGGVNQFLLFKALHLLITGIQQKPAPEAYLGYALYDADSNRYDEGRIILSKKARNRHEELETKIHIQKDGYIEAYVVNESEEDVWFDQFRVLSSAPVIVQETHYDPWGVELSGLGYQYGGIKVNPYLYNGKEANTHAGVNLFDYGARMYDPAIGRWFVSDPLAEAAPGWTPYRYGFNNPMRYTDPTGMIYDFKNGETVSYGGSDYVLHDNRWLPLMSKEVHAKYKKDYNNPKGGRPLTREEYAIVGYNIDLGINDGLRGALYGGWSGIIEKIATGKLNWSFITMFAGYTGGRLDAFEKMYERMKEHDRRVEHLREKDK
jgi:RHS repeat-associated protein